MSALLFLNRQNNNPPATITAIYRMMPAAIKTFFRVIFLLLYFTVEDTM